MSINKPPPYQPNDRRDTAASPGNVPTPRSNRESWFDTPEVDIPEVKARKFIIKIPVLGFNAVDSLLPYI